MKRKVLYVVMAILSICLLLILTGCESSNKTNTTNNTTKNTTNTSKTNTTNSNSTNTESGGTKMSDIDYSAAAEKQMSEPEEGEQIAIFHIKDYGDVKVKFFPDVAPKAVENFVTHAKEGYYDGLTFHRVIDEFMIQGGDPEGTGMGGESIWGEGFGTELDYTLVPYRGSLCMAMSSLPNSIGSQFFITQANYSSSMYSYYKNSYPVSLLKQYKEYGGYLSLYMQYTVFGQVFEGMDVVDKIAETETDSNDKPLTDVVIETIEVTTYSK
jgi:cyclophilin family peptidyl-prolyl cis-trans isomerase